ncbi:MAG: exo-alpha-sialidase [Ectothiorhodospiraceae bacterium]|nr:exo-alpha-sialidase [Ectothiorhodospiraceae bacterium]MCH8506504.1 glycoside hydrolase [Ectothiorhodospiraceae bacterium]
MAMVSRPLLAVLLSASLLSACGDREPERTGESYRYSGEGDVLSLAIASSDDTLHLVWVEDIYETGPIARHSRSDDGGASWSTPTNIDTGQPPPDRVHRSNDIRVAASGDAVYVVWQTRGEGWGGSGPMVLARSPDGGGTWQAMAPPATTEDSPSHGFFALTVDLDERVNLAWLDNRHGQQGLLHATASGDGAWTVKTVAETTCECCWNSLLHTTHGNYLLFRGKQPRDMGLAERRNAEDWQVTGRVGTFDWQVDGCPHVGGGLAMDTEAARLHALVWTAHEDHLGLHHLHRRTNAAAWSEPRRIGSRDARNADLASLPGHAVLAAWDQTGADAAIFAAWVRGDRPGSPQRLSNADHRASHPQAALTRRGGHVIWTERGEDGMHTWRMHTLPFPD